MALKMARFWAMPASRETEGHASLHAQTHIMCHTAYPGMKNGSSDQSDHKHNLMSDLTIQGLGFRV